MNFGTRDLATSIAFYETLLGAKPAKTLDDYALFITGDPGLELALNFDPDAAPSRDAHYGICVEDTRGVDQAIARLQRAGLAASIEREETCCYANQTKVWAVDPEGRRWEVYTVHEETETRETADTACCSI